MDEKSIKRTPTHIKEYAFEAADVETRASKSFSGKQTLAESVDSEPAIFKKGVLQEEKVIKTRTVKQPKQSKVSPEQKKKQKRRDHTNSQLGPGQPEYIDENDSTNSSFISPR